MSKPFDASGALNGRSDRARDTFDCSEGLAASAILATSLNTGGTFFLSAWFRLTHFHARKTRLQAV